MIHIHSLLNSVHDCFYNKTVHLTLKGISSFSIIRKSRYSTYILSLSHLIKYLLYMLVEAFSGQINMSLSSNIYKHTKIKTNVFTLSKKERSIKAPEK